MTDRISGECRADDRAVLDPHRRRQRELVAGRVAEEAHVHTAERVELVRPRGAHFQTGRFDIRAREALDHPAAERRSLRRHAAIRRHQAEHAGALFGEAVHAQAGVLEPALRLKADAPAERERVAVLDA